MSDQIEKMRQLAKAKQQKKADQTNKIRPEKNINAINGGKKTHKKSGGLFDGK